MNQTKSFTSKRFAYSQQTRALNYDEVNMEIINSPYPSNRFADELNIQAVAFIHLVLDIILYN